MNVNDIAGMEILNATTACNLGTVSDVIFDKKLKKAKALLAFDNETELEMTLPIRNVGEINEFILTNLRYLTGYAPGPNTLTGIIGTRVIDSEGHFLDRVKNVCFTRESVTGIVTEHTMFLPDLIKQINDGTVLLKSFPTGEKSLQITTENVEKHVTDRPFDKKGAFDFLLSMRTKTNLYDYKGNLLIPSGKLLDEKDLELAVKSDKIIELCCISQQA